MSQKTLRYETIRLIDQNATDFIADKKKSNNLITVMGHFEVRRRLNVVVVVVVVVVV